jgi:hypothetical protein
VWAFTSIYSSSLTMMRNKRRITYLIIIILTVALLSYQSFMNQSAALSKSNEEALSEQMEGIREAVKSDLTRNTQDFLTYPVEDSKDEFTTLYTYLSLGLLDKNPPQNVCEHFSKELSKDEFIQTEESFYTGIERLYFAMKLLELCNQEEITKKTIEHAEASTTKLYHSTYFKEGYFLSDEFKEFKDKEGYEEVKFFQTHMMLKLGKEANIDFSQKKESIAGWLNHFINDTKDPLFIRHYLESMNLLNIAPSPSILNKMNYEPIIQKDSYKFHDILTVESLTYMHKKEWVTLTPEELLSILQKVTGSQSQFANIQQQYYVLSIYSHLGQVDKYLQKDRFMEKYNRYVYPDGMMPLFSQTSNPYSTYYSMVTALTSSEEGDEAAIQLQKYLSGFLKGVKVEDLMDLDSFEILSYISLKEFVDESFHDTNEAESIKEAIKEELPSRVNAGNIIKTSYLIDSLALLKEDFNKDEFPENTSEIINNLRQGKTKLFENSTDFSNLLFINSLAATGKFSKELKEIVPYATKINIDLSSEVAAYELYQKNIFLKRMGIETDDNKIAGQLIKLHNGSGYKLNEKQSYQSFYATIFLNRLNHILLGEEKHHDQ